MEKIYSGRVKLFLLIVMLIIGTALFVIRSIYVNQYKSAKYTQSSLVKPQTNVHTASASFK